MKHQIYTVIFLQGINRTSKLQNHIVVACDEFLGAHKHLPVFGIFNYIHQTGEGGHNTGTTSETGHRQNVLQRHGIWWCPSLENVPPTSNGTFWYPIPCTRYTRVMDPGFSWGGCTNSKIGIIFCQKLHENERIWKGMCPSLDPSMLVVVQTFAQKKEVTLLKCTHTMYSLQILLLPMIYTHGWYQLQLLTNYD